MSPTPSNAPARFCWLKAGASEWQHEEGRAASSKGQLSWPTRLGTVCLSRFSTLGWSARFADPRGTASDNLPGTPWHPSHLSKHFQMLCSLCLFLEIQRIVLYSTRAVGASHGLEWLHHCPNDLEGILRQQTKGPVLFRMRKCGGRGVPCVNALR